MGKSSSFSIREACREDEAFLFEMLYQALFVPPGELPPDRKILEAPEIRKYVEGWGRPGDTGLIAESSNSRRDRIGALWLRRMEAPVGGFGYIADDIPELSMTVAAGYRGKGLGTELLEQILRMPPVGVSSLSLSVQLENPAFKLYRRMGFMEVGGSGSAVIMRFDY